VLYACGFNGRLGFVDAGFDLDFSLAILPMELVRGNWIMGRFREGNIYCIVDNSLYGDENT
jgi:hypothetical protein